VRVLAIFSLSLRLKQTDNDAGNSFCRFFLQYFADRASGRGSDEIFPSQEPVLLRTGFLGF
jgi:hypothetical protein